MITLENYKIILVQHVETMHYKKKKKKKKINK